MNQLNHPWEPEGLCIFEDPKPHPARTHEPNEDLVEARDEDADEDEEDEEELLEPGTQVELSRETGGWVGIEPDGIEDEENPTLFLEAGEEYEIGWTEGDGGEHNIAIHDGEGDVVDGLSTDVTSDPGNYQWVEFEASDESAEYVCEPHLGTMVGSIVVQDSEDDNGDN